MKAAVCYEFGSPLVVEDLTIDPPQDGEVHVRMAASSICHSDLHAIAGDWTGPLPFVPGHESSGVVMDVGPGVVGYEPGDRVLVTLMRQCGRCYYCVQGLPQRCETVFPLDRETRLRNSDGKPVRIGLRTASFAEEAVLHQSQIIKIPDDLPFDVAALLSCGVITGAGAVLNTAQVKAGSSVVVIGTGGVGLNSIQAARIAGAYPIVAVDVLDAKLEIARQFGATHTANPRTEDPAGLVRSLTERRGADYVFVAVGNAAASELAFTMLRPRGMQVIIGLPETGATASFPVGALVQERTVTGSMMGSTRLVTDIPRLTALYRRGALLLDELITNRYPLAEINAAIASSNEGNAIRNVIVF